MSDDALRNELRKELRRRRLGPEGACLFCGERTAEALLRVDRTLLERHHVVGVANDSNLTSVVCRNCHAKLTEAQLDHGVPLAHYPPRDPLERLEAFLLGLASFFEQLVDSLRAWAGEVARIRKQR